MAQRTLPIQLDVTTLNASGKDYQTLAITLTQPKELISPSELLGLTLPTDLDFEQGIILFGQAPIWLYCTLISQCKEAPWLACYNARSNEAVVVQSQVTELAVGDIIQPTLNQTPCPAILIGGPPNSGKSVFSNALRQNLIQANPSRRVFLHRANWDGEGNWTYESPGVAMVEKFVLKNEHRIHEDPETRKLIPKYFEDHAEYIQNLRSLTDILLVDVGGMPQDEKYPLLKQCTHYIIISRLPEKIDEWHQFCQPLLNPLTVIHSVKQKQLDILNTEPILEINAGPWLQDQLATVPQCVLEAIATKANLG